MYRLLVVDDECMITDLLSEYLQQKLESETEIYKAYSGRRAVEIFKETNIDILLTDINMPGMSGLELHRLAKQANPGCKIIFLTGYHVLDNIQYALRNESVDFILKTESNEIILNSIYRAISALESELNVERLLSHAQEQMRLAMPIMHERLVMALLSGEELNHASFAEIDFPLNTYEDILLLLGHIDNGYTISSNTQYQLKNLADSVIGKCGRVFSVIEGHDILWLVQPTKDSIEKTRESVRSDMDNVHQICRRAFNVSMSMALSRDFIKFEDIQSTWIALKQTIKNLHGLSDGMLLIENKSNPDQNGTTAEWLYLKNILQNIQLCIDSLQREKYDQHYEKLAEILKNGKGISPARSMEAVMRLYLVFLSNDNGMGTDTDISFAWRLTDGGSWEAYDRLFREIAEEFFSRQNQSSFRNTNQLLMSIKEYINANLGSDLSLNRLAEIANFSPSYLSRLFKQVANISLTEYIGRLKYKRAAKMLQDSDMKIADIASSFGFETPSYFTRFFKKHAGVGPQEYRENFRIKKDNRQKKYKC